MCAFTLQCRSIRSREHRYDLIAYVLLTNSPVHDDVQLDVALMTDENWINAKTSENLDDSDKHKEKD